LQATLGTASATGTVPTNTASSASNHPPLDTPVPVLVAGHYSTRAYIQKYVTAEECAIKATDPRLKNIKDTSIPVYSIPAYFKVYSHSTDMMTES